MSKSSPGKQLLQPSSVYMPRPVDMFRANLADGAPLETMIKTVCDEYNVTLKLDGEKRGIDIRQ